MLDVIKRQAGTLQKATLEGTMNACEAGAKEVRISYEEKGEQEFLSIFDDGEGITTLKDVKRFFNTFGTPHEESEHKTWAEFRMGRGQMFSFGKNVWRTGTFEFIVDVKNRGLKWTKRTGLPMVKGCQITIELYNRLIGSYGYRTIDSFLEKIQEQVRYIETPVFFNGKAINTPPSTCKWDIEDENAFYMFGAGVGVSIYNLGAFALTLDAHRVGCTGVIVSKKKLQVNFARNDILNTCPVYAEIQKILRSQRKEKTRRASYRIFTEGERVAALVDLRDNNQEYKEIKSLKLIMLANRGLISLEEIRKSKLPWTFAEEGDRVADRAMQREQIICVSERYRDLLNYMGEDKKFFDWLCRDELRCASNTIRRSWEAVKNFWVPTVTLREGINEDYRMIAEKKLTKTERRLISVLEGFNCWKGRSLRIGDSDVAAAWTNGSTYITMSRTTLRRLSLTSFPSTIYLMAVLCHELAHDINTAGTHIHSPEFYTKYHEITCSNDWFNPLTFAAGIPDRIARAVAREKEEAIIKKQNRQNEKVKQKLGVS